MAPQMASSLLVPKVLPCALITQLQGHYPVVSSAFLCHAYKSKMRWPQPLPCHHWYIDWIEHNPRPHAIRVEMPGVQEGVFGQG